MDTRVVIKFPFCLNLLNARLRQEEKDLIIWKKNLEVGDALSKRMAEGNIPSTESRIKELKEVILLCS